MDGRKKSTCSAGAGAGAGVGAAKQKRPQEGQLQTAWMPELAGEHSQHKEPSEAPKIFRNVR
eukprot:1980014-Karenia_brevis.AAC.1